MINQKRDKFRVLVDAPVFSRSGYGAWADDLVPMLINYPKFDVSVGAIPFGACVPRQTTSPHDALIQAKTLTPDKNKPINFDICIAINLPTNSRPVGNIYNINFSAGLEVDQVPDYYMAGGRVQIGSRVTQVSGVNDWDLSVMMSQFAKVGYYNSKIKPTKAVEVLNWGMDTDIFKIDTTRNARIDSIMSGITEEEAFLYVGQRTHPNLDLDRKNSDLLLRLFCETFKGSGKKPALIMKTNGTNFSNFDRDASLEYIKQNKGMVPGNDCNIYLLHGEMSNEELNALYNHPKIIANVSLTRGEGYSGSHLQSSLAGKPTIISNHSGYLDYLEPGFFIPLAGKLQDIPKEAVSQYYMAGSKWFEVDPQGVKDALREFYNNPTCRAHAEKQAKILAQKNRNKFNLSSMQAGLYKLLDKYLLGV